MRAAGGKRASLPTRYGTFTLYGFYDNREGKEHTAIVQGDVRGRERVPAPRALGVPHRRRLGLPALRLPRPAGGRHGLHRLASPFGAVIYLKQEGRGIGLLNKIKAYQLQDLGLDTVEANQYLDLPVDARDYKVAAKIIELLKIRSVALLTNNPDKIDQLKAEGIDVVDRIPIVIPPTGYDKDYLDVKKRRWGTCCQ